MARERRSSRELEALWKEKDMADGRVVDTMVIILRTRGCFWSKEGGCHMCGYNSASSSAVTTEDLLAQLDAAMERYRDEPFVKIYTSGSFLDDNEVPPEVRTEVFRRFSGTERLLFESRPEFVLPARVAGLPPQVTVALGLESANDAVLRESIHKGFSVADHRRAAQILQDAKLDIRNYVLLKPPFLSERAAIRDSLQTIRFASSYSTEISINPLNVQRGTLVERLWKRGNYRPPWIWSLMQVMEQGWTEDGPRIVSSPSGGGTPRGVHNCRDCDGELLKAIERFSFNQDVQELQGHDCGCRKRWHGALEAEAAFGTTVDLDRNLHNGLAV
jgi:radical SAM enzyme (TIGR01210 family)